MRRDRVSLTVLLLALGVSLGGCESLEDWFNTKKPLPGERRAVFPNGVPGVPQGVPPELVKGYQPPAEPEPAPVAVQEEKPKPKPKPRPRKVAQPRPVPASGGVSIRPAGQSEPQPGQPAAAPSPFPDPPKPSTFSR